MVSIYEEVEIEDMAFNDEDQTFYYPCPCGDKFAITLEELLDGEDIGHCPSCTLKIRVIYDDEYLAKYEAAIGATTAVEGKDNEKGNEKTEKDDGNQENS